MDAYLTPQKENIPKQSRTLSNNRLSDWVCVVCNNLNFSFRKKCNRCKTQTRHQNELATAYSQYYYEQLSQPPIQCQQNQTPFYEFRNSYLPDNEKYSRNTKQSYDKERKENGNSTAARPSGVIQENRKDVFGCDLWKQLEVRDFQEFCHESQEQECVNTHAFNERELQNLINKILL